MAKVLREVSFNALHIFGSLGTTDLTPLQAMYAAAPTMGIADGVDEVHKATVARNVLRGYQPHERPYWPTEYFPPSAMRHGGSSSRCSRPTPTCVPLPRRPSGTSPSGDRCRAHFQANTGCSSSSTGSLRPSKPSHRSCNSTAPVGAWMRSLPNGICTTGRGLSGMPMNRGESSRSS